MKAFALCIALLACGKPTVDTRPPKQDAAHEVVRRNVAIIHDSLVILRFAIPFQYGVLRLQVEQCAGVSRDGWPAFYVSAHNPLPGGFAAFYDERSKSIVFALGNESEPATVAHELLHFVLAPQVNPYRQRGESPEAFVARVHPETFFGESGRCAHLLYPTRS